VRDIIIQKLYTQLVKILIIQEYLLKLCKTNEFIDDDDNSICCEIPYYELIMLDECE